MNENISRWQPGASLAPGSDVMVCKVGSAEIARAFPVQWSLGFSHPCQHGRGFGILFSSFYCITLHHSTLLSAESTCRAHCSSVSSLASTHCFYTPLQHLHCLHSLMIILSHSPSNTQMTDFNGPFDSVPFCPFHRSYLTKYVPNLDLKYSIN